MPKVYFKISKSSPAMEINILTNEEKSEFSSIINQKFYFDKNKTNIHNIYFAPEFRKIDELEEFPYALWISHI